MYAKQKNRSKSRNHENPLYTRKELYDWCVNQELFHELYKEWEDSGYDTHLVPTVDRLDDSLPYSFDNIQLLNWIDNSSKSARKVICYDLEDNIVCEYSSTREAARAVNTCNGNIVKVCEGRQVIKKKPNNKIELYTPKTSKGFKWKYKESLN